MSPGFSTSHLIAFLGFLLRCRHFIGVLGGGVLSPSTHSYSGVWGDTLVYRSVVYVFWVALFWLLCFSGEILEGSKTIPICTIKTKFPESDIIFVSQLPIISFVKCLLNSFPQFTLWLWIVTIDLWGILDPNCLLYTCIINIFSQSGFFFLCLNVVIQWRKVHNFNEIPSILMASNISVKFKKCLPILRS